MRLATLGPIGYLPAPGTVATLCTVPLVLLLRYYFFLYTKSWFFQWIMLIVISVCAYVCIRYAIRKFLRESDPQEIVLDEVVGFLWVFISLPCTLKTVAGGFVLFRFFDITKLCGISYLENIKGAWGIVLDDIAAGIIVNIILRYLM